MSALTARADGVRAAAPGLFRLHTSFVAALLLGEALLLIFVAKLLPRLIAHDAAETPSVWAVGATLVLGFALSRRLSRPGLSTRRRVWTGLAVSLIALQIIARVDLSETATIWDLSWLIDLARPSSDVWREAGAIDEMVSSMVLIGVWFRGVALGSADLDDRPFANYAVSGLVVLAVGATLVDNAGIEDHFRTLALLWVVTGLITVALKNASDPSSAHGGTAAQTGLSLAATLGALIAGVLIALLVVTGLVALIAGSGVVEPVLDIIGTIVRAIVVAISYMLWPFFWLAEQLRDLIGEQQPLEEIQNIGEGVGRPVDVDGGSLEEPDPTPGIVLSRVLGGIGAVLALTILGFWLFRRLANRSNLLDEERESVWGEADVLGDLMSGLRGFSDRFRRDRDDRPRRAPIAELYFELLADAAERGTTRALHRTPLQFADVLTRAYSDPVPSRISEAFSEYRYGGRQPSPTQMSQLSQAWRTLREREESG